MLVKINEKIYLNPAYVIGVKIAEKDGVYSVVIMTGAINNGTTESLPLQFRNKEDVEQLVSSLNVL